MRINSPNNNLNKQRQRVQCVNFEAKLKKINPYRLLNPDSIIRHDKFGLDFEAIEYLKGTNSIISHLRSYPEINLKRRRSSDVDFFPDGQKTILTKFYDSKYHYGVIQVETRTRNYNADKKLTSKIREYHGKDKNGEYKSKITTTYRIDGKTPAKVIQNKMYAYAKDGKKHYQEPITITTLFDEQGKALTIY